MYFLLVIRLPVIYMCSIPDGPTINRSSHSADYAHAQLLKRYVAYAKAYCHPTLTLKAARVLQKLYLTMRNEARDGRSMPITMRQLESLVRLAQVTLGGIAALHFGRPCEPPPRDQGLCAICRVLDISTCRCFFASAMELPHGYIRRGPAAERTEWGLDKREVPPLY